MFEANQIRALLGKASPAVKAMILLGVNCGFGNSDVGSLTFGALDLRPDGLLIPARKPPSCGAVHFGKKQSQAPKAAIKVRPAPKDEAHDQLVFITRIGQPWSKDAADSPISKEIAKLLARARLRSTRPELLRTSPHI